MRLHEYQAKKLLSGYGIPTPKGRVAFNAGEVRQIAEDLGSVVVLKSQVLVGGRGKAGGIRLVRSAKEAEEIATKLFGMEIKSLRVRKVLVEEAFKIEKEIYLAITYDRDVHLPVILASTMGGDGIEEVSKSKPEQIIKVHINPLLGLLDYQFRYIVMNLDISRKHWHTLQEIAFGMWQAYLDLDALLVEVNPLVVTADGHIAAIDSKVIIDDNALFRHLDLAEIRDLNDEDSLEVESRNFDLYYVRLSGDIGCMVNGAGLAMATVDMIKISGGNPANFMDIGGGANAERVAVALKMLLSDKKIKAILVSVFGGITRCDEVAIGILNVLEEMEQVTIPIVVRLAGTNAEMGKKMLSDVPVILAESLAEAASKVIQAAKQGEA